MIPDDDLPGVAQRFPRKPRVEAKPVGERRRASAALAELLFNDLGVDLKPSELEVFLAKRWGRIAPLAHIAHAAPDQTK